MAENERQVIQLGANSKQSLKTDRFISRYSQVDQLSKDIAKEFLSQPKANRVLLNLVDVHNTNNIGGFNISNFKMRYLNEFINEVISDYEQSLLGSVIKNVFSSTEEIEKYEIHMSVTKFKGDIGYSLV